MILTILPHRIFGFCGTIINERKSEERKNWSHTRPSVNTYTNAVDTTNCALKVRWCLHNKWITNMIGGENRVSLIQICTKTSWIVEYSF